MVLAAFLVTAALPLTAQEGFTTVGPQNAESPQMYASTGALFADSLLVGWDGEEKTMVRLRIVEVVKGQVERILSGGTYELEPGPTLLRLEDLMPAGMIGRGAPILRWTHEVHSLPGAMLTGDGWDDKELTTLIEPFPIDWTKESLLIIGLTAVEDADLRKVGVMPFLVVRPYEDLPPEGT
jgi:hypothetical protein